MIKKPMLAETLCIKEDELIYYKDPYSKDWLIYDKPLPFPLLVTPKIDGIRCLVRDGKAVSREFKPIPNHSIRQWIVTHCPEGFDGELDIEGLDFNEKQSQIMSHWGAPDFRYKVFDVHNVETTAELRETVLYSHKRTMVHQERLQFLLPTKIYNLIELRDYENEATLNGYEGVMLRHPQSPYKEGRSTLKQFWLIKLIRIAEDEAVIHGFTEEMYNANEATTSLTGHTQRSSHKDNKIGKGTLGALIVKSEKFPIEFKVDGFTSIEKSEIWENRHKYIGKTITYKYKPFGVKDAPRSPKFKAFREGY